MLRPGVLRQPPPTQNQLAYAAADFAGDEGGQGCPYGSHVRRMQARPDGQGRVLRRTLLRRSVPYGPAVWADGTAGSPDADGASRGHLSHFFCASLEDQPTLSLRGFQPWTTTRGMVYAWYPAQQGLRMLFEDDFVPEELEGPWR